MDQGQGREAGRRLSPQCEQEGNWLASQAFQAVWSQSILIQMLTTDLLGVTHSLCASVSLPIDIRGVERGAGNLASKLCGNLKHSLLEEGGERQKSHRTQRPYLEAIKQ